VFKSKTSAMPIFSTNWQFSGAVLRQVLLQELRPSPKVIGLSSEPDFSSLPGRRPKDRQVIAPAACAHRIPRTCLNDDLNRPGLPAHYSPHSFRATRITNFLENDGTLEAAQRIAGHARQLYDRRGKRFCSKTSSASGINVNLKKCAFACSRSACCAASSWRS